MIEYRRASASRRRRLTGLEWLGVGIAILLLLLALFMSAMAVWASFSPSMRAEAKVTISKAWTAALVATVIFSAWVNLLLAHLSRRQP